jgi:adenylosuccinate synthase
MLKHKTELKKLKAVVGLSYGNEGKGSIVNYLAHKGDSVVVRVNGDYSSSHTVSKFKKSEHSHEYKTHSFRQLSSGALNKKCKTYIAPQFIVEIDMMYKELIEIQQAYEINHKVYIDNRALVILPIYHSVGFTAKEVKKHTNYDCSATETLYIHNNSDDLPEVTIGRLKQLYTENKDYLLEWLNEYSAKYTLKRLREIYSTETEVNRQMFYESQIMESGNKNFIKTFGKLIEKATFVDSMSDIPDIESTNIILETDQGLFVDKDKCPINTDATDLINTVNELDSNILERGLELIFVTRSYKTKDTLGYSDFIDDEIAPDYYMYDKANCEMYDSLNYELDLDNMSRKMKEYVDTVISEVDIDDKSKISSRIAVTHLDETQDKILTLDGVEKADFILGKLNPTNRSLILSYGESQKSVMEYEA